jgi:hypothetical protein
MKNGRCRYHGGLSTGAMNPVTKHGYYTNKAIEERKSFRLFMQEVNEILDEIS